MKKLFFIPLCFLALVSCEQEKTVSVDDAAHQRDSLLQIINQKDDELNDIVSTINEVQEGFRQINEAEGRVTIADGNLESASSKQAIRENITFIQQTMEQNKKLIERLTQKLKTSSINSEALQKTIKNLQTEQETLKTRVQELEADLAEKDIVITQQNEQIEGLNENVNSLTEQNRTQSQTIATQDKSLHKAWFVFGTKAELKEQNILKGGEVLQGNFNKDYFTEIDSRELKEIKLYSKNAEMLTSHPAGSYTLEKDVKGQYVLKITNASKFWSVSKYLVVQVK